MVRIAVIALLWLCAAAAARAELLVLDASADATLYQPLAGDPETADSQGPHLFVGRIVAGTRRRTLLRFDPSTLPANALIQSARLELTVSRTTSGPVDVGLHRVSVPWSEGSANAGTPGGQGTIPGVGDPTWSLRAFPADPWASAGGDFAATASATLTLDGETRYLLPATAAMRADLDAWRANPAGNHGWLLLSNEAQSPPTAKRLESAESSDPAARPLLVIEYALPATPVPGARTSALVLLAFAILLAALRSHPTDTRRAPG